MARIVNDHYQSFWILNLTLLVVNVNNSDDIDWGDYAITIINTKSILKKNQNFESFIIFNVLIYCRKLGNVDWEFL